MREFLKSTSHDEWEFINFYDIKIGDVVKIQQPDENDEMTLVTDSVNRYKFKVEGFNKSEEGAGHALIGDFID